MLFPTTTGMHWHCDEVKVTGNIVDDNGKVLTERLELWRRNPVECIRELIGNPAFREIMGYAPERVFMDPGGSMRIFHEMWTGDWWWKMQVS